jgi:hypothetical protein
MLSRKLCLLEEKLVTSDAKSYDFANEKLQRRLKKGDFRILAMAVPLSQYGDGKACGRT